MQFTPCYLRPNSKLSEVSIIEYTQSNTSDVNG